MLGIGLRSLVTCGSCVKLWAALVCNIAGELVAQFKFTLLLMPNGPMKITGLSFDESLFESENSVTDEEMKVHIRGSFNKFQDCSSQ